MLQLGKVVLKHRMHSMAHCCVSSPMAHGTLGSCYLDIFLLRLEHPAGTSRSHTSAWPLAAANISGVFPSTSGLFLSNILQHHGDQCLQSDSFTTLHLPCDPIFILICFNETPICFDHSAHFGRTTFRFVSTWCIPAKSTSITDLLKKNTSTKAFRHLGNALSCHFPPSHGPGNRYWKAPTSAKRHRGSNNQAF